MERRSRALFSLYWVISLLFFLLMIRYPLLLPFLILPLFFKLLFAKNSKETMWQGLYQGGYFFSYLIAAKVFGSFGFYSLALLLPASFLFKEKITPSKRKEAVKAHALKPQELFSWQESLGDALLLQCAFLLLLKGLEQATNADLSSGEGLIILSSALNATLLLGQALSSLIKENSPIGLQWCKFSLKRFSNLSLGCLGFSIVE